MAALTTPDREEVLPPAKDHRATTARMYAFLTLLNIMHVNVDIFNVDELMSYRLTDEKVHPKRLTPEI